MFQRNMNNIFHDVLDVYVIINLDDILIFSANEEDHIHHVRLVMDRLRQHSLQVKLEKCVFHVIKIDVMNGLGVG
jgi:hypothetical protein